MALNETEFSYDQIQEYYNSCRLCTIYNNRLDQIYNKLYKDILNLKDFRELVTQFMKELKEAYELSPVTGFLEDERITNFHEWLKYKAYNDIKIRLLIQQKKKETSQSKKDTLKVVTKRNSRSRKRVNRSRKNIRKSKKVNKARKSLNKSKSKVKSYRKKSKNKKIKKYIDSSLNLPLQIIQTDPNNLTVGDFYYIKHNTNDPPNMYSYYGKFMGSGTTYAIFEIHEGDNVYTKNFRYSLYDFFEHE